MGCFFNSAFNAHVGDHAYGEAGQAHLARGYHFWNGAHANGITTDYTHILVFRRSFQRWAGQTDIGANAHVDVVRFRDALRACDHGMVVRLAHVRETRPEFFNVSTDQWVREKADVVVQDHQVARLEARINTAAGVAHEKAFDTDQFHHPHGQDHLWHGPAFVVVKAALHGHHGLSAK